jgi:hypothetical protein
MNHDRVVADSGIGIPRHSESVIKPYTVYLPLRAMDEKPIWIPFVITAKPTLVAGPFSAAA